METFKRKSIKKIKIEVSLKKIENMYMLFFTLEKQLKKPEHKICIGSTRPFSFCESEDLTRKVNSIFKNDTTENVYCLEDDIIRELAKQNNL